MQQQGSFGQRVRQRRRALDLTQDELARRVGCAAITVRRIEAGDLRPSQQIAERLAMALAIPLDERAEFVRQARAVLPGGREPAPTPTPQVAPEEIGLEDLSGRAIRGYALGERIGSGGFGAVYRAVQPLVEREVAIKIILPQYANHPDFIRRFEAEAQLVARLEHPHIVPLYDYWREPGVAYLVMRLLRGGSAQDMLQGGPLPFDTVWRMIDQIGGALHAAHRAGVIHRDLKPANVLLDEDQNAYLVDFGIAKNLGNPNLEDLTQIGAFIGSPAYSSPEQIRADPIRPQADIYSLGVMLYELLTGARPFMGPTPLDFIQQHLQVPLPPLSAHHAGLPAALDTIIARATAKDPLERYESVLELMADLRAVIGKQLLVTSDQPRIATPQLPITNNPYKGLRAFSEADAADFFGRETLTQQLLARLGEGGDLARFLAVVGPSGSGKSSVVKAGLVPALRRGGLPGSENWFIVDLLPGPHPLEELEAALLRIAVNPPESLLAQLREDRRGLLRAVRRTLPADDATELVLVIDQFEEVFTLVEDEAERAHLLDSLVTAALDERSRVRILVTLRADFIDRPLRYVDFGELLRQRSELVLPLTPDEMERAIAGPAERAGLALEPGLTEAIVADVSDQPGALPLLQYALTELFEQRDDHTLTKAAYHSIGGVRGALGRRAEEVYASLNEVEQSAACQLSLRLVTLGEGTEDTRRRVLRSELESLSANPKSQREASNYQSPITTVIDTFGRARLLSFDRDLQTRGPTVEVAHEALLREWTRLREWLDDSRADVRMQRSLAAAAAEWNKAQRDPSYLLTGAHLGQFEGWALSTSVALTGDERAYLDASLVERDRRLVEEAERQRRELEGARKLAESERQRAEVESQRAAELAIINSVQQGLASKLEMQAIYDLVGDKIVEITGSEIVMIEAWDLEKGIRHDKYSREKGERFPISEHLFTPLEKSMIPDLQQGKTILWNEGMEERIGKLGHSHIVVGELPLSVMVVPLKTGKADQKIITAISLQNCNREYAFSESDVRLVETLANSMSVSLENARLFDETQRLFKAEQERVAELQIINSIQQGLAAELDFQAIVDLVGDKLREVFNTPDLGIRWYDEKANLLHFLYEYEHGKRLEINPTPPVQGGPFEIMRRTRQPVILNTPEDFAKLKLTAIPGTDMGKSLASVPIISSDRVLGVIGIENYERENAFGESELRLLTTIAASLGTALENARLFDETQRLLKETEQRAEEQARTSKQLRKRSLYLAGAFVVALIMALTALFFSVQSNRNAMQAHTAEAQAEEQRDTAINAQATAEAERLRAENEKRIATSRELAAAALSNLDVDPERSILLALRAVATTYDVDKTVQPQAEDALHRAVITSRALLTLSGGHTLSLVAAEYSLDGTRIATGGQDGIAKIWDAATGQELLTLQDTGSGNAVNGLAYSPDGTRVATANDDGTVKIWDTVTGHEVMTLAGHSAFVVSVAYSPDGTRVAASSGDGTVIMWDAVTGKELFTVPVSADGSGVVFSPDGKRFAVSSDDNVVAIRDVASGNELVKLSGHTEVATAIKFSPDGTRVATVSADSTARVWDATTGAQQLLLNLSGEGLGVAFSPDGKRLATSGFDGTAAVWDATSGKKLLTLLGHTSAVYDVSFSPDGTRLATAGRDNTAKVWDITPSRESLTFIAADSPGIVSSLAYSPDGSRLATANNNEARVWDAVSGKLLLTLLGHSSDTNRIIFSPDGTRLVTASDDQTAKVWDAVTGRELLTLTGHTARIVSAAFSPDGRRLATASEDGTARIWDARTGKEMLAVSWFKRFVTDIAFSPDGKYVVTAGSPKSGDISLRTILWDPATGQQLLALSSPGKLASAIAFSPDGKQLALGYVDGSMKVYSISPDGLHAIELFTPRGHSGWIEALTYSPDGKRFTTASDDGTTKIWDAATGQELLTLSGHDGGVHAVAFSPDGTRLATGGIDGTVRIYFLKIEDLVALAKSRLTHTWTTDECQKYLHVEVCPGD